MREVHPRATLVGEDFVFNGNRELFRPMPDEPIFHCDSGASVPSHGNSYLSDTCRQHAVSDEGLYRVPPAFGLPEGSRACRACLKVRGWDVCPVHRVVHRDDHPCYACEAEEARRNDFRRDPALLFRENVNRPDPRFPRLIGIEFETGPWLGTASRDDRNVIDEAMEILNSEGIKGFAMKGDPSLETRMVVTNPSFPATHARSWEIVTAPIMGAAVPQAIDNVFRASKKFKFSVENIQAGMHIHVDARDLYESILEDTRLTPKQNWANLILYLNGWMDVCKKIVSKRRANNFYCCAPAGLRSEFNRQLLRHASGAIANTGYAGIALRMKTLEFRLWPSSNSKENILARAELSSAIVTKFLETEDRAELARTAISYTSLPRPALISDGDDNPFKTLGLSETTMAAIKKMVLRFNKEYFMDEHAVMVSSEIPDPDTVASLKAVLAPSTSDRDFRDYILQGGTTMGDTLAFIPAFHTYLHVEEGEPVTITEINAAGYRH
jgi:hypothetical protein